VQIFRKQISINIKSKPRWGITLAVSLVLVAIGLPLYRMFLDSQPTKQIQNKSTIPVSSHTASASKPATALGRIEPKGKVITISGSSSLQFARVGQIRVKEGERVQRGQVIAVLDNLNQLQTALEEAKKNATVVRSQLDQVKAGEAKRGEIAAQKASIANIEAQFQGEIATQKAAIARLKAELKNARTENLRFEKLYQEGTTSASTLDSKSLKVATLQEQLNEAKATLNQILLTFPRQVAEAKANLDKLEEVRPVDVQVARAKLEKAIAAVHKARADLDLAYVQAPVNGQILKIHTFAGESISSQGIVDLAQTQAMYVVAEVYETEIDKVRIGQKATISSSVLKRQLKGTVEQISSKIGKKNVFNSDPTLDIDARVIEVKIRLDSEDSQQAANLINLQVDVKIDKNL
jgi:HlyD family secretion protein